MLWQQPGCWDFRAEEEGEEWKVITHSRTLSLNVTLCRYLFCIINLCNLLMPAYPSVRDLISSIEAVPVPKPANSLRRHGRVEVISMHSYPQPWLDTLAMYCPILPCKTQPPRTHTICYGTRGWVSTGGLLEDLNIMFSHKTFTLHTMYIVVSMFQCWAIKEEQYKLTILHKIITFATVLISKVFEEIRY